MMNQQHSERTWMRRGFLATLLGVVAAALLFPQLSRADETAVVESENFAANQAAAAAAAVPFDVRVPEGADPETWIREQQGRAAETYGPPLMIPAADFNGDSQSSDYFFSFINGVYQLTDGCHMAPVYLPHGSGSTVTVNNFYIFALDNNAGADITFNLRRKQVNSTAASEVMATVTTSSASTGVQVLGDLSVDNPVVSTSYVYSVTWCYTGTNQGVQGFWIFFTES